ncbi:MAG: SCO family protein [Pirellulaceae bacterium]
MFRAFIAILASLLLIGGLSLAALAIGIGRQDAVGTPSGGTSASADLHPAADSQWLTSYVLTERSGRPFASSELAGKVHVVNFFFTSCPTICRMQTAAVQDLAEEFGPQGVKFLSITCDPDTDTPVRLAIYAKQFEADPEHWLFLTGDLVYLRRVGAEMYFLPVDKGTHSESLLLLDRAGKIRGRFSWKQPQQVADMKKMMTELLAESPEEAASHAAKPPAPAATPTEPADSESPAL